MVILSLTNWLGGLRGLRMCASQRIDYLAE